VAGLPRGASCSDAPHRCDVGLYCDYPTMLCQPLREDGESCALALCRHRCNHDTQLCQAYAERLGSQLLPDF
jgi:hypothetical protein